MSVDNETSFKKVAFVIRSFYLHIIRVISVGSFIPLHMRLQASQHSLKTFCESALRTAPYCPHSAHKALILRAVCYSLTSSLMLTHCFIFFDKHDYAKLKNIKQKLLSSVLLRWSIVWHVAHE